MGAGEVLGLTPTDAAGQRVGFGSKTETNVCQPVLHQIYKGFVSYRAVRLCLRGHLYQREIGACHFSCSTMEYEIR